MKIVSIVFEDGGSTFSEECLYTVQQREKPIIVTEYVYSSSSLQKADIKEIIGSLQKMDYTNEYSEPTNTIQAITRVSKNPPITESKTRKDMKQNKKTINETQLRAIVKEAVKSVLKENLSKADDWYRARVVDKLLKSWERYGCMEDAQNAYHRGMYEFLCFISPMLGDADMLTPQEGSEEWDANSEWDFSKQDKEVGEMRKNRLEPSYNPYD